MEDLKQSMKDKNVLRKNVVQMVRTAILQVEKDKQIQLDDNQVLEIIAKESKKRKDSFADYEKKRKGRFNKPIKKRNRNSFRVFTKRIIKGRNRTNS